MRREFDDAFARPVAPVEDSRVPYVLVRVGSLASAVRADALDAIAACPAIVRVPARAPALVGIAALRGSVLGLYSLGALLGSSPPAAARPEWILVCADRQTGLIVDEVVGYVHASSVALRRDVDAGVGALVDAVLDVDEGSFAVLDLPSIMQRIKAAAAAED